jgi:UDP-glucose 4-epimerase
VTGGVGFIGSHLCRALLAEGDQVVALDDLSSGSLSKVADMVGNPAFQFIKGDCRRREDAAAASKGVARIFHLAAIAEVRPELHRPLEVFERNVLGTQAILEAARSRDVRAFVFASSSTVYGEPAVRPTPEDYSPLEPISLYGSTKLASEALISGYVGTYGLDGVVLRLANVVGEDSRRGVIFDFMTKLKSNSSQLEILGDGSQSKSYLHVEDCVRAFLMVGHGAHGFEAYNVGSMDQANVRELAALVARSMGVRPKLHFTGGVDGGRGWKGDVKDMLLDIRKMEGIGWRPALGSLEAVQRAVDGMLKSAAP